MKISKLFILFLIVNNSFNFFGIEECCDECDDCCREMCGINCYPCLKCLRLTIRDKYEREQEKKRKEELKKIKKKEEEKKLMRLLFNNKTEGTIQNLNNSNEQDYSLLKKIFDKIFASIDHEKKKPREKYPSFDSFYPLSEELYLNINTQEILEELPTDKKEFLKIQIDIHRPIEFKHKINYNLNPLYKDLTFSEYSITIKYDFDDEDEKKYKYINFYIKVLDCDYNTICKNENIKTCLNREIKNMNDLKEKNEFNFFYGAFCYSNTESTTKVFLCYNTSPTDSIYKTLGENNPFTEYFINEKMLTNYKNACLQLLKIIKGLRELRITHRNISMKNIYFHKILNLDFNNILDMRLGGFELSSEQMKNKDIDENLECKDCSGEYLYKSPIFKRFYIQKQAKEYGNIDYFNAYNEDLFAIAVILYNIEKISEDYLIKKKYGHNLFSKYDLYKKERPKIEPCLYFLNYEYKIDDLLDKDKKKELTQEEIVKLFEEDINAFKKYFESEDFLNNEEKLYNKIFLKFKDKNDNDTIEIDDFINELNP